MKVSHYEVSLQVGRVLEARETLQRLRGKGRMQRLRNQLRAEENKLIDMAINFFGEAK